MRFALGCSNKSCGGSQEVKYAQKVVNKVSSKLSRAWLAAAGQAQSPTATGGHAHHPACSGEKEALRFGLVRALGWEVAVLLAWSRGQWKAASIRAGDSEEHEKYWLEITDILLRLIKTAADFVNSTCRRQRKASWWWALCSYKSGHKQVKFNRVV